MIPNSTRLSRCPYLSLDYPEYLEKDGKRVFYQITDEGIILRRVVLGADFIVIEVIRRWLLQQKEILMKVLFVSGGNSSSGISTLVRAQGDSLTNWPVG